MHGKRKYFLFLLPLMLFLLASTATLDIIRVGIYDNPPLSFVDDEQKPQGFLIDVLERIAEEEGWQLEYHLCEWEACLQALESGEIDLLGPIGYSEERSKRFDFSGETLITNWGQVYVQSGETNISIVDFSGKRIALLVGDIHADVFLSIVDEFDIEIEPVYFDSYLTMLEAIDKKEVYGGVFNHLFAMQHAKKFDVGKSAVIFNPIEVRFATTKGSNGVLLADLDAQLEDLKSDDNSIYYQALDIWLQAEYQEAIPVWLFWLAGIVVFAVFLLGGINHYLRQQVSKQTAKFEKSREELALIMDRIPSMIAFVDCNQRYIYVDESYASWYGFKKEEVVGKLIEEVLPPDNYAKVRPHLEEMLESGKELHYEHKIVRRDGKSADVAISYTPKLDSKGKMEAFFATVRDVTEERKVALALQESELKYRRLVDNSLIGVYILQQGKIKFANQGLAELFGYERAEEMLELDVQRVISPHDWELVKSEIQAKETEGKLRSQYSFKALRVDGSLFDVEIVSGV